MAAARELPGWPSKKLVREVRRHLGFYGIHPTARGAVTEQQWRLAWAWAHDIANSYFFKRWPSPQEVAAQYLFLVLAKMQTNRHLKLPYRASQCHRVPTIVLQNVVDVPQMIEGVPTTEGSTDAS